ncbi:MAG: hypothetical protein JWO80_4780, partial [Bryobacterales bacterium]|nr:hypothetical protein [Bryobacterales bacterium]
AIFSIVDAVLLRWLPVKNPQELVFVATLNRDGTPGVSTSYPDYEAFRDRNHSFDGIIAYSGTGPFGFTVKGSAADRRTELVGAVMISGNYFQVLGVESALGRTLNDEDNRKPGAAPYVVLSYNFWKRRFAQDPRAVGSEVTLNGYPFTVVGVVRSGFTGLETGASPDIFLPVMMRAQVYPTSPDWNTRHMWWLTPVGRLRPGVSWQKAAAELTVISSQQTEDERRSLPNPKFANLASRMTLLPGSQGYSSLRRRLSEPLIVLMIVVALVLLIACANVANLLLARAAARQKEIAIRLAIGASRSRLISQLLTESTMLALMGGLAGLLFAWLGVRFLLTLMPLGALPVNLNVTLDWRLLGFTVLLSGLTGLTFGVMPALQATRAALIPSLKDDGGAVQAGPARFTVRKLLIVTQVALSLLLLIGASLFVRSLGNLRDLDSGFRHDHVMQVQVDPGRLGYRGMRVRNFYDDLAARVRRIQGVQVVSLANITPLGGSRWNQTFAVQGRNFKPGEHNYVDMNAVSSRYFETMGIPLLAGRDFRDQDNPTFTPDPPKVRRPGPPPQDPTGPHVAIVNEAFVRRFFHKENPLGQRFSLTEKFDLQNAYEIVGVAKDVRYYNLRDAPEMMIYLSNWRPGADSRVLCLRTAGDPMRTVTAIRREVLALDPAVPVLNARTMDDQIDNNLLQERVVATLSSFFGGLALLLAAVGLYGVLAHSVTRRRREIGIRMALGAQRGNVLWLILRDAVVLVLVGAAVGIPVALAVTKYAATLLYGITARDPLSTAAATGVLVTVAVAASYLPARRATKVDPMEALRYE